MAAAFARPDQQFREAVELVPAFLTLSKPKKSRCTGDVMACGAYVAIEAARLAEELAADTPPLFRDYRELLADLPAEIENHFSSPPETPVDNQLLVGASDPSFAGLFTVDWLWQLLQKLAIAQLADASVLDKAATWFAPYLVD